jgi:hypothetical protein
MTNIVSISKLLFDAKVFQYVDSASIEVQPYKFNIKHLGDKMSVMKTFIKYLSTYIKNLKLDIETVKFAGIVSFHNMESFPLIIELGIEMEYPFIMVKNELNADSLEIQGSINIGDDIVLILDEIKDIDLVIKTIKTIERSGGLIECIIILMDNDDGKCDELHKIIIGKSIIKTLFNMSTFIESLATQQLLTIYNYEKIANYVNLQKTKYIQQLEDNNGIEGGSTTRVTVVGDENQANNEYPPLLRNILRAAILTLMMEKKTALCLSLDLTSWNTSKQIINVCGDYICMVKTRITQYTDITNINEFQKELYELAAKYKFFVLEDTGFHGKPKEIWNLVVNGYYGVAEWFSFVTVSGNVVNTLKHWDVERDKTHIVTCPILQTSYDTTMQVDYMKELKDYEIIAPIVITQNSPDLKHIIKLTPNILLKKHVPTDSIHRSIEDAIVRDGNHIVIMGSSIYKNAINPTTNEIILDELLANVKEAANDSWRCFGLAYSNIITKIKQYKEDFAETRKKMEKTHNKIMKEIIKKETSHDNNTGAVNGGILNRLMSSFRGKSGGKNKNTFNV